MSINSVCVFCASSSRLDESYISAARLVGVSLAGAGLVTVYGGGSTGLMGSVADGALGAGGRVVGVLPRFMDDVEWGHTGLSELVLVEDMHERVKHMKELSDAFVVLPGGCGTFDELFQALTWKRLGLHVGPIVLVNTNGFFDHCCALLERCIADGFMNAEHGAMWTVVDEASEVVGALGSAPAWSEGAIRFARPGGDPDERPVGS